MMREITLYGAAGERFGRTFRLDVASPAEAVRALMALRPGFATFAREQDWQVVVGPMDPANEIDADALAMSAGSQPLHFVPATKPHGNGGSIGKIIVGVVLIGAAIAFAPAGAGLFGAAMGSYAVGGAGLGLTFGQIALLGVSMVAAGVSGLLAATPTTNTDQPTERARPEDRPSFVFNGVTNNSQQGGPVPIVCGRHLVGSVVIGGGIAVEDIAI